MGQGRRIAIISGASRGIGQAIAKRFATEGTSVVLLDILKDELEETVQIIKDHGGDAEGINVDITREDDVKEIVQTLRRKYGRVDIIVNNAGISPKHDGKRLETHEITLDEWNKVIQVNLTAPFLLIRECLPIMMQNQWGRIINMSSQAGRTYSRVSGTHYTASKTGIIGLTRTVASAYGKFGITANCIAPGRIKTPMTEAVSNEVNEKFINQVPAGRSGTVDEVAALAYFLGSEESGYINGAVVDINGGMHMS